MSVQRYVSDELTHFGGRALGSDDERYQLLTRILSMGWLIAPGTEGDSGPTEDRIVHSYRWHKRMSDPEGLSSASAVCFCDIPVADLGLHVTKYSRFGLAFSKAFLIGKNTAPVFYVPRGVRRSGHSLASRGAGLKDEIQHMHGAPIEQAGEPDTWKTPEQSKLQTFFDYLVLPFIKAFDETKSDEDPESVSGERSRASSYNRKLWMKRKGDVPFWGCAGGQPQVPGATRGERYATYAGAYHWTDDSGDGGDGPELVG